MASIPREKLEAFAVAARRVDAHGLVRCSSGNLSWRVDGEHVLVTPTRVWMAGLSTDQVAVCRLEDGAVLNGMKPSVEAGFHLGILRERPGMNVVLHHQSPYATAIACRDTEALPFDLIPEIPFYIGPIAMVPYLAPGSEELANALVSAMKAHDMAILRNHGQVTVGVDFDDAIQKACFFELACEILLRCGGAARAMPDKGIAHLRAEATKHKPGAV